VLSVEPSRTDPPRSGMVALRPFALELAHREELVVCCARRFEMLHLAAMRVSPSPTIAARRLRAPGSRRIVDHVLGEALGLGGSALRGSCLARLFEVFCTAGCSCTGRRWSGTAFRCVPFARPEAPRSGDQRVHAAPAPAERLGEGSSSPVSGACDFDIDWAKPLRRLFVLVREEWMWFACSRSKCRLGGRRRRWATWRGGPSHVERSQRALRTAH
jgi:hypothetical protein